MAPPAAGFGSASRHIQNVASKKSFDFYCFKGVKSWGKGVFMALWAGHYNIQSKNPRLFARQWKRRLFSAH